MQFRSNKGITASAAIVTPRDPRTVQRVAAAYRPWQNTAWTFYDQMAEIHYPGNYIGGTLSRFTLHIGVIAPDQPAMIPHLPEGAERTDIVRASEDALIALGKHREILRRHGLNRTIAADGWLYGEDGPDDTTWEYLSIREIHADEMGVLRRYVTGPTSYMEDMPDPRKYTLIRFWNAHPAYSQVADGPMNPLQSDCERLIALNDSITSRLLSRLAQAGLLYIPNTINVVTKDGQPDGTGQPVGTLKAIVDTMEKAILNRGTAAGSLPIMLNGPSGEGDKIVHVTLDRLIDEQEMMLRAELRNTIATGMYLPREAQTGMQDATHWQTWAVNDGVVEHLQPIADDFAADLTTHYLWNAVPKMFKRPLTDDERSELKRVVIFADGSNVVTRPNRTQDAVDLNDRAVLSDKALRQSAGRPEEDAPTDDEYVRIVGRKTSDPYLATWGLPVQEKIDWSKVSTRGAGAPGPGGQGVEPASKNPADNGNPVGGPGTGDAGKTRENLTPMDVVDAAIPHGIRLSNGSRP